MDLAKSVRKNYIYNACYQVMLLITPLVVTPYLSRVLKADGIGTASYAISIVSYFALFAAMGIPMYGRREVSYVQENVEARSVVFWNTKLLECCTSIAVICVYIWFALCCQKQSAIYLILTLNLFSVFFDITWFFQGLEEFGKVVARNTFFRCLQIAYCFIFVKSKNDLYLYILGLGLFTTLGNLSLWAHLPKYICMIHLQELHPFKDIKTVWSLFIPTIAIEIYTVFDKTMIGLITGSSFENGYYEQAIKVSKMLLALVTAMGTVMVPRIGHLYGQKNNDEIRRLMYRGYRFVWFLGIPLCFGIVMVADNFVPWFFGDGYEKVIQLLRVTAFLILAIGVNNVTGIQYLIPTRRQNTFSLTVIIGAVVNFFLNLLLIYHFQSIGAAIASVAAETTITVVQFVFVRRELSPWQILKEGIHYYIAGIVMVLVLYFVVRLLSPSMFHTAVIVVIGAAVYFGTLVLERDSFLLDNWKKVLAKLRG